MRVESEKRFPSFYPSNSFHERKKRKRWERKKKGDVTDGERSMKIGGRDQERDKIVIEIQVVERKKDF